MDRGRHLHSTSDSTSRKLNYRSLRTGESIRHADPSSRLKIDWPVPAARCLVCPLSRREGTTRRPAFGANRRSAKHRQIVRVPSASGVVRKEKRRRMAARLTLRRAAVAIRCIANRSDRARRGTFDAKRTPRFGLGPRPAGRVVFRHCCVETKVNC